MDESCITFSTWVQQCFRDNRMLLLKDKCTCKFPSFSTLLSFWPPPAGSALLLWQLIRSWTVSYLRESISLDTLPDWLPINHDVQLTDRITHLIDSSDKKKHCVWWMRSTHWFWFTSIYFNHSLMETFLDKKVTLWPPFIRQFWVEQLCGCMCNGIPQSWGPPWPMKVAPPTSSDIIHKLHHLYRYYKYWNSIADTNSNFISR